VRTDEDEPIGIGVAVIMVTSVVPLDAVEGNLSVSELSSKSGKSSPPATCAKTGTAAKAVIKKTNR